MQLYLCWFGWNATYNEFCTIFRLNWANFFLLKVLIDETIFLEAGETSTNVNEEYHCTLLKGIYTWQKTNSVNEWKRKQNFLDLLWIQFQDDSSRNTLTRDASTDSTPTPSSNSSNAKRFVRRKISNIWNRIYAFAFQNFDSANANGNNTSECSRHGGEFALAAICHRFNADLQSKLPDLYNRSVVEIEQFTDGLLEIFTKHLKRMFSSFLFRFLSKSIEYRCSISSRYTTNSFNTHSTRSWNHLRQCKFLFIVFRNWFYSIIRFLVS